MKEKLESVVMQELSLDPKNWEDLRNLGHQMLDDMFNYLETIRERPAWRPLPDHLKASLNAPLPEAGEGAAKAYADFKELVLPFATHGVHPRFWGWVAGNGTGFGMLSELLAAGLNVPDIGFNLSSSYVELQILDWCKAMLGYPKDSSGILVSGGSVANLVGLTVARNSKSGFDVKKAGLNSNKTMLKLYGSQEMHSSIDKAVEILGLGDESIRKIPVGQDYKIDLHALQVAIADDRKAGFQPFCVVGNAGTVNTGAFDDLASISEICKAEDLWFHVDGAFGAWVALPQSLRHLVKGMEMADSVAFDMHKWMYMQYEVGCCLVRHSKEHHETFATGGSYLNKTARGFAAGPVQWREYGIELSRGFRALKVWMSLKEQGVGIYRKLIEQNVLQAQYLASLVKANPSLELLAPVASNIVCFRFTVPNVDDLTLNRLNQEILIRLQEQGIAVPSSTILNGRFAIRAAITNHRSRREDFRTLTTNVVQIGQSFLKNERYVTKV